MSGRKKAVIIGIVIMIIAGLITGAYFLFRWSYTVTVKLSEEVKTTEQAYRIANEFVQKRCPGAGLISYTLDMKGKDDVLNRQPSGYRFEFGRYLVEGSYVAFAL